MNRKGELRREEGVVYTKTSLLESTLSQEIVYLESVFRGWGAKEKELVSIRDLFVGEQVDTIIIKQIQDQVPPRAYGLNIEPDTLRTFYAYLTKLIGYKKPGDPDVYDNADLRDGYKIIVQRVVTRSNVQSKSLTLGLFKDFCDSVLGFVRELRETGVAYPKPLSVESPKPDVPPTFSAPLPPLRSVSINSSQGGWHRYKERDKTGYVPTLYESTFYLDSKERLVESLYKMLENPPIKADAPHADFSNDEYFLALFQRVNLDVQLQRISWHQKENWPPYTEAGAMVFLLLFLSGHSKTDIMQAFNSINPFQEFTNSKQDINLLCTEHFSWLLKVWEKYRVGTGI